MSEVTKMVKTEREMQEEYISENTFGNIWVLRVALNDTMPSLRGHKHEFDHMHYGVEGEAKLTCMDKDNKAVLYVKTVTKGTWHEVPKGYVHFIERVSEVYEGFCIHALRNEEGQVVKTNFQI